jgi:hypothetical protein
MMMTGTFNLINMMEATRNIMRMEAAALFYLMEMITSKTYIISRYLYLILTIAAMGVTWVAMVQVPTSAKRVVLKQHILRGDPFLLVR